MLAHKHKQHAMSTPETASTLKSPLTIWRQRMPNYFQPVRSHSALLVILNWWSPAWFSTRKRVLPDLAGDMRCRGLYGALAAMYNGVIAFKFIEYSIWKISFAISKRSHCVYLNMKGVDMCRFLILRVDRVINDFFNTFTAFSKTTHYIYIYSFQFAA